jgi:hypothetical protein
MTQTRRTFISTLAVAGAAIPFVSKIDSYLPESDENKMQVRLFSKPLDAYDFSFLCECVVSVENRIRNRSKILSFRVV